VTLRDLTTGHRKLFVYLTSIAALLVGLVISLVFPAAGLALYGIYTAGIATAQGVFTYGNVREKPPEVKP
jgi:hypothetical protein